MAWRAGQTQLLQSPLTRAVIFSALTTATAFGSLWLSSLQACRAWASCSPCPWSARSRRRCCFNRCYGAAARGSRQLTARTKIARGEKVHARATRRRPVECMCRGRSRPLAPMCRLNANPASGLRIAPAAKDAAARPDECIYAAAFDESQFKVTVERRDGDAAPLRKVLSLRQSFPGPSPHACWHFGSPVRVRTYCTKQRMRMGLNQSIATLDQQTYASSVSAFGVKRNHAEIAALDVDR